MEITPVDPRPNVEHRPIELVERSPAAGLGPIPVDHADGGGLVADQKSKSAMLSLLKRNGSPSRTVLSA
ncbi:MULTISPECIES: hypothetical protein, partial [unclassified Nocardioides]|uniref:hypothetical protein n=1 Tax=unclassified Nocardioides TaxID=2615069 RepID=UPI0030142A5E